MQHTCLYINTYSHIYSSHTFTYIKHAYSTSQSSTHSLLLHNYTAHMLIYTDHMLPHTYSSHIITYIHVHIYIYIHTYPHILTHLFSVSYTLSYRLSLPHSHTFTQLSYAHMPTYLHILTHTHVYMFTHRHKHLHANIYLHIDTHAHIYTCSKQGSTLITALGIRMEGGGEPHTPSLIICTHLSNSFPNSDLTRTTETVLRIKDHCNIYT